jgi:hypothetical protein
LRRNMNPLLVLLLMMMQWLQMCDSTRRGREEIQQRHQYQP